MLRRIRPDQVRLGMYIHGFEGSWIKHPFWRSKFLVTGDSDLARLREADVPAVIIDEALGAPLDEAAPATPVAVAPPAPAKLPPRPADRPVFRSTRAAPVERPLVSAAERAQAQKLMMRSKKVMAHVFDGARLGQAVRSAEVIAVVEEISASVLRNPHALIGVTRLKSKDEYTYLHSVAVCTLMINLARELGLDEAMVRDLGLAGLLHDVGKMAVPEAILNKEGPLDDVEFRTVRDHPAEGHRMLTEGEGVPPLAMEVCLRHHEKIDGTGYPDRLAGEAISLAARMGAICDVYDALTSNRAYKTAWTPTEAITAMAGWDGHFDRGLLFRFMQSILVFPEGMLVRLRSNRLAVVRDNGRKGMQPRAIAFYATSETAMIAPEQVLISHSMADDQIVSEETPEAWGLTGWDEMRDRLLGVSAKAA